MQIFGNRFGNKSDDEDQASSTQPEQRPIPTTSSSVRSSIGFDTVLGPTSTIEGDLSTQGNLRLDGEFSGNLDIGGNVLVGETARISADIDAANVSIAGTVRGNVTGNKVQLLQSARVWGDIIATSFSMEEGAFIDGKISMPDGNNTDQTPADDDPLMIEAHPPTEAPTPSETDDDHDIDGPTVILDPTASDLDAISEAHTISKKPSHNDEASTTEGSDNHDDD